MVESSRFGLETPDHVCLRNDNTTRQLFAIVRISFDFALIFFSSLRSKTSLRSKEEYWEITHALRNKKWKKKKKRQADNGACNCFYFEATKCKVSIW